MRVSLAPRLVAAFAGVAVLAVSVLAILILLSAQRETSALAESEQAATGRAVASELAAAHAAASSWREASFGSAAALSARADSVLMVRDTTGRVVYDSRPGAGRGGSGGHPLVVTVRSEGEKIGSAELRFRGGLSAGEQRLRTALGNTVLIGSLVAVVLAAGVALLVSRRMTRPLVRLTAAAHRLEHGDRSADGTDPGAPGELGELARAFDRMAATIEREEAARRRLAADLSHELRTPLTIVRGGLEELVEFPATATPERLASLNDEVLRLGALLEQLDVLARADLPQRSLDCRPFRLDRLAGAIVDAARPHFAAKGVVLEAHIEPVELNADRVRVGQVVENLVSNALKFTPPGGRVTVGVGSTADDAVIEVADTGPGIRPDELPRVFDRFWRGASAGTVAGQGIGLSIVADISRAHGGAAEVDSEPGRGARFRVRLPRRRG